MIRALFAATTLLAACATPPAPMPVIVTASMPPEIPGVKTPVEIVGDYAGRRMKLVLDGRIIHDGPAEPRPSGTRWIEQVGPGSSPAELVLELENCPVYRAQVFRSGVLHAVTINGCNITLIGA